MVHHYIPTGRYVRLRHLLKMAVICLGFAFFLSWGAAATLLVDGHPFSNSAGCTTIDGAGVFWECNDDKLKALGATAINTVIVLTIAMPVFAMAAYFDTLFLQVALPGVLFNALGLPAAMFLMVRGALNALYYLRYR